MIAKDIPYIVDGIGMVGHLVVDGDVGGRRPAVLIAHEGTGLDDHVKRRAERLAALGYCTFALDYLGGGRRPALETALDALEQMKSDLTIARRRAVAGLDMLLRQPQADADRVAVVGYCWGGAMALEVGRSGADVKAIIGFHPSLTCAPDSARISAKVLMCLGSEDPLVSHDERAAFELHLQQAGVADWQVHLYGGAGHSFTNKDADLLGAPGIGYHSAADARSWEAMLLLLTETIGS